MKRLMTGILLAGSLLASCSNDSTSEPQNEPTKETEQSADNSNKDSGKENDDAKPDSLTTSDSLAADDSVAAPFEKALFTVIYDHSKWNEANVLEIDTSMSPTGREFMQKSTCDSCAFEFKNLKLKTPYALLKIDYKKYAATPVWSFVDLSRTDTAYLNVLTTLEYKRILKLIKDGVAADSAEKQAQSEILKEIFNDIPKLKISNQIPNDEKDSVATMILQVIQSTSLQYNSDAPSVFAENGKLDDSLMIYMADHLANGYMYEYSSDIPTPRPERPITTGIYGRIYGFGECSSKNIDTIRVIKDSTSKYYKHPFICSEKFGWYSPGTTFEDTYTWEPGHDGELRVGSVNEDRMYAYDSVQGKWISPSMLEGVPCITSNLGKVIKESNNSYSATYYSPYRICEDLGYQLFWNTATKEQYYSQGIDCDSAYTRRPSLMDSTVQVLCYEGRYTVIMPTEPDEPHEETLLDKEAKLIPCGEDEESFHQGQIDTTIYYLCYKGEISVAAEFDMIMGHPCKAEHKGYYSYQNSIYSCNGFAWHFASDSLVTGTVEDERDGTVYGTIGIGDQIWLSENMNLAIDSSWCPEDSLKYCENFGRLYRWDVILGENAQVDNICPTGFRVPTNEELEKLEKFGKTWFKNKMDTQIFKTKNFTPGEDLLGFSLYLAGGRSLKGSYNGWRSSTNLCSQDYSDADSTAYVYRLSGENSGNFVLTRQKAYLSCSVRCIKD